MSESDQHSASSMPKEAASASSMPKEASASTTLWSLPSVAYFGRSYEEYLTMFEAMDEGSLAMLSILDCNSGPSSFTALANARGLNVTACDPTYEEPRDVSLLREKGVTSIAQVFEAFDALITSEKWQTTIKPQLKLCRHSDDWIAPNSDFRTSKLPTLEAFLADFATNGDKYIAASLPHLPFPDQAFDLVLSSHFLFCYAPVGEGGILESEQFDLDFHLKAVEELARVTKLELRITPTHSMALPTRLHAYLAPVMAKLSEIGFEDVRLVPALSGWIEQSEVLVAKRVKAYSE